MTRTGKDATDWAKANAHRGIWYRQCLSFVRQSFGRPGGTPSAGDAWDRAKHKHHTNDGGTIPAGVPVFWETSSRADHIAISVGSGLCRSTDVVRRGNADIVGINALTRRWGMDLQGWTEDLNGARVWHPSTGAPVGPVLDLSKIVGAAKAHTAAPSSMRLKKAVASEVGTGEMDMDNPVLGGGFEEQYADVQRKYLKSQGEKVTGKDADGLPGRSSLIWLGRRHGFRVVS